METGLMNCAQQFVTKKDPTLPENMNLFCKPDTSLCDAAAYCPSPSYHHRQGTLFEALPRQRTRLPLYDGYPSLKQMQCYPFPNVRTRIPTTHKNEKNT